MKRGLYNSDKLFDSPEYGWEEMKFLLDINLPTTTKNSYSVLGICIFISLTALLLVSSLVIRDNNFRNIPRNSHIISTTGNMMANGFKKEDYAEQTIHEINLKDAGLLHAAYKELAETKVNETRIKDESFGEDATCNLERIENAHLQQTNDFNSNKQFAKSEHSIIQPFIPDYGTSWLLLKSGSVIKRKSTLQFSIGAAVNTTFGQRQSPQPFPAAELLYKSTSRFYVSLGLAPCSVVSTSSHGISKTVYLNDTSNNIRYYNKVTSYTRLCYIDLPLLAGVKIDKRFSAEVGLQASILINTKSKETIDKYDFQMELANTAQNTLLNQHLR